MPPKPQLAKLVTPHPELQGKETCAACLEHLQDEFELLARDKRVKPHQLPKKRDVILARIKRLWWKSGSKQTVERYKHFAHCPRQDDAIRTACKKAKEQRDNGIKSPIAGSSRSSTSVEPPRVRKSTRAPIPKQQYREETVMPEEELEDLDEIVPKPTAKAKGKRKAAPIVAVESEDEAQQDQKAQTAPDFTDYFTSKKQKTRERSHSPNSSVTSTSASEDEEEHEADFDRDKSPFSPDPSISTAPTAPRTASRSISATNEAYEAELRSARLAEVDPQAEIDREIQECFAEDDLSD